MKDGVVVSQIVVVMLADLDYDTSTSGEDSLKVRTISITFVPLLAEPSTWHYSTTPNSEKPSTYIPKDAVMRASRSHLPYKETIRRDCCASV